MICPVAAISLRYSTEEVDSIYRVKAQRQIRHNKLESNNSSIFNVDNEYFLNVDFRIIFFNFFHN